MENFNSTLFLIINNNDFSFIVGNKDSRDKIILLYNNTSKIKGYVDQELINIDEASADLKKNIYLIEQKLKLNFNNVVLILNNDKFTQLNLSGFKKLNGSQLSKENISYILSSLKSSINECEKDKTILHIFNPNYLLDKKKMSNLPIGLFGDLYAQEISCFLINTNYFKNLNNLFFRCNLKIKKIFLKSFIDGVNIIKNSKIETFVKLIIGYESSNLIYFENSALKYCQKFKFGSNIIIKDIAKVTSLSEEEIKKIISISEINNKSSDQELIEKDHFKNLNYRKIKKKFLLEIANARIKECSDIIMTNNLSIKNFIQPGIPILLKVKDKVSYTCFKESFDLYYFANKSQIVMNYGEKSDENTINDAYQIVHYGWKKEAVPFIHTKKSLLARFFDLLFT